MRERSYFMFCADSDQPTAQGEGLTRTTSEAAVLFRYRVRLQGSGPLRGTIRAENKQQAEKFLTNRHPNLATIEEVSRV